MSKENPAPDIESIWLDQDREFATEYILSKAKKYEYGNFATAKDALSKEFLPSGDPVLFLSTVIGIGGDVLSKSKNPTEKWNIRNCITKLSAWITVQENHKIQHGRYSLFPASPEGILASHLKA